MSDGKGRETTPRLQRGEEKSKNHERTASQKTQKSDQKQSLKLHRNHRFLITFGTFLTSWAPPGTKGKPTGFQTPLWEDFGRILGPIGDHLATLFDKKLAKRLLRDAFGEVLGEVSKKASKFVEFLTLSNPLD